MILDGVHFTWPDIIVLAIICIPCAVLPVVAIIISLLDKSYYNPNWQSSSNKYESLEANLNESRRERGEAQRGEGK